MVKKTIFEERGRSMSRKNHEMIDGKLLQTDKKYSQLKLKQKEKIADWMFQATRDYYTKKYVFPNEKHLEEVVNSVYEKIVAAEIWIPYGEVFILTNYDNALANELLKELKPQIYKSIVEKFLNMKK